MRADFIRTTRRGSQYSYGEDTLICRMVAGQRKVADIAMELGRSEKSVYERIRKLRISGDIAGYTPRRKLLEVDRAISLKPPLELRLDDDLVRYTRRLGGFPRAVVTSVGTVWANGDGLPWRYGQPLMGEAA